MKILFKDYIMMKYVPDVPRQRVNLAASANFNISLLFQVSTSLTRFDSDGRFADNKNKALKE